MADVAISIVIPTHNRRDLMAAMLRALEAPLPGTPAFEVVAVADGCVDGTQAMLRGYQGPIPLQIIERPGLGPSVARNAGAAAAVAPLLLFLDDDVIPTPGLVLAHAEAHAANPGGVVIGPYPPAPHAARDAFRQMIRLWWHQHFAALAEPGHRFTFRDVLTGNLSIAREQWEALGGLDPQFARAREDYELGVRIFAQGFRLHYAPKALGWHHEHQTSTLNSAFRRAREEGRSDALMALKHPHLGTTLPVVQHAARNPGRLRRLVFRSAKGRPLEWLLPVAIAALSLCNGLGWRQAFWTLHARLHRYAYLRGAASVLGNRWWKLQARAERSEPAPLAVDLADGFAAVEAQLAAARPRAVRVMMRGDELALLPDEAGAEPWDARHFRPALLARLGARALLPLIFGEDSRAAGWADVGVRNFDAQLAEARRQWARADL